MFIAHPPQIAPSCNRNPQGMSTIPHSSTSPSHQAYAPLRHYFQPPPLPMGPFYLNHGGLSVMQDNTAVGWMGPVDRSGPPAGGVAATARATIRPRCTTTHQALPILTTDF